MTSQSSLLRCICMRPSAWLSVYLAISPVAVSDHPSQSNAKPIAHFTDVAAKAGLTTPVVFGGENTKKYIIETTGTGVAIFYFDNDGWPDIFVVNGPRLEGLPSGTIPTSHLYRNNHDGTFTDVSANAGAAHNGGGRGQAGGDSTDGGYDGHGGPYLCKTTLSDNTRAPTRTEVSGKGET